MSSDLKDAKKLTGSVFPEGTYDSATGLDRLESMLTASKLKTRFLGGLPMIYPTTKEKIANKDLEDFIHRAQNQVELELKTTILPVIRRLRLPFDPNLYHNNIWCEIAYKPVQKIVRLAICSASYSNTPQQNDQYPSGAEIYKIPNEWIDTSYAKHGKLFVNPINPAFSAIGTNTAVAASGATILQFIGQQGWVPAYWTAEVVTGLGTEEGQVPVTVNELVGAKAAILLIDNLILAYRFASQSMGVDGLSQSVNDNMQTLLQTKRQYLDDYYKTNIKHLKTMFGNNLFTSNV